MSFSSGSSSLLESTAAPAAAAAAAAVAAAAAALNSGDDDLGGGWNFLHEAAARLSATRATATSPLPSASAAAAAVSTAGGAARVPHTANAAAKQLWDSTQAQQQQQQDVDVDLWDEASVSETPAPPRARSLSLARLLTRLLVARVPHHIPESPHTILATYPSYYSGGRTATALLPALFMLTRVWRGVASCAVLRLPGRKAARSDLGCTHESTSSCDGRPPTQCCVCF